MNEGTYVLEWRYCVKSALESEIRGLGTVHSPSYVFVPPREMRLPGEQKNFASAKFLCMFSNKVNYLAFTSNL